MRATIGWLCGGMILAIIGSAVPALAGGGGGGGGVTAVSVPALTPLAFGIAQLVLIGGYLLLRHRRR